MNIKKFTIRFCIATFAAVGVGLTLHIFLQSFFDPIVTHLSQAPGIKILQPSAYTKSIIFAAYITALFPLAAKVFIYYFIGDYLWFKNKIMRGIMYALLTLMMSEQLIRMPIMNLLVGAPLKLVLAQQFQPVIINILVSIVIALIMPTRKEIE